MHEKQHEIRRLESGWKVVLVIWGAILASLGVYFAVCINIEDSLQINISPNFPINTLKYALFGLSCITLFVVYYLRKSLMRPGLPVVNSMQMSSTQHPALAKYMVAIVIMSALLESIGIYGVVLFLLAKDVSSLYQLLIISAAAMIYFRPRKEELLNVASQMKKHTEE